jgi:uncharacterized protein (TIGR02246 family)
MSNTELMAVESRFWDALKDRDPRAAATLTEDECILVGAQGVMSIGPEALGKMLEGDLPYEIDGYAMDESKTIIRKIGNDLAIVAYPVHEDLHVEGKRVSLDAYDATVWLRKNGKWVTVLHTESIAGDPFGRDRNKVAARPARTATKRKPTTKKKTAATTARKRTRARSRR